MLADGEASGVDMADFTGTSGNDAQTGTSGDETFDYSQGGDDTLVGGDGADKFQMGDEYDTADSVDGGAGLDTLFLDGAYGAPIEIGVNITGIERITLEAGHSYELDVTAAAVGATGMKFNAGALGAAETLTITIDPALVAGAVDITGGAGDDTISLALNSLDSLVDAGDGDDQVNITGGKLDADALSGGGGTDTLSIDATILAVDDFNAGTMDFEELDLGKVSGSGTANNIDLASFASADADGEYNVRGEGGDDVVTSLAGVSASLHGNEDTDTLSGGDLGDQLLGNSGADLIFGGKGDDLIKGGADADVLGGGRGSDTYYYSWIHHSTGLTFDTIRGFDADEDKVALINRAAPAAIDAAVVSGQVRGHHFNDDMEAAVDGTHLGANNAVLFTADAGGFSGVTFLVIDANGIAGYQADEDFVIQLDAGKNLGNLGVDDFVSVT
jgi:Ca2+-binding RTX toxin-like protein